VIRNELKRRLEGGKSCINAWLMVPSTFTAEAVVRAGWDSVTVDIQHGLHDYASAVQIIQVVQSQGVTPLVRVPWNEPGVIGKVLDAGAWGIICPMVNTAAEAEALVRACLYPPQGMRSFGPVRSRAYGGEQPYHAYANDDVLILPQIETRTALENIESILDVPGISGIYVGPSDLALSFGLEPALDREEPQMLEIYERLIAATAKRGITAGIQTGATPYAARMARLGFGIVTIASDLGFVQAGSREVVTSFRAAVKPAVGAGL
jgi:4-hydroxy-2-oxoheptanedioate aldolase